VVGVIMSKDVSNETVFVLAILAILVSVLSVATIFFEASEVQPVPGSETSSSTGMVKISIVGEPQTYSSEGSVILNVQGSDA
jgi:hypothetical protein